MKRSLLVALLLSSFAFAHDVQLSCTPNTSQGLVTGFVFSRATVTGGPYTVLNSTPLTSCTFDDTSAPVQTEGQTFFYVVKQTGPGGASPNSAEASAVIPFSPPATPGAPTTLPK